MMNNLEAALATCLSEMEAGHSLEDCLARYGTQAGELRELLILAGAVRAVPVPRARPEVKAAQMQKMLAALQSQPAVSPPRPNLLQRPQAGLSLRPAWRWSMALVIVLLLVFGGGWASVSAAAGSLPGDLLYPIKRAQEQVEISLTINPAAKEQLREEFFQERLKETQAVLDQGRQVRVEFAGSLNEITRDRWQVGEFQLVLDADTMIVGEPGLGRQVLVYAQASGNGRLLAITLLVERDLEPQSGSGAMASPTEISSPLPTATPLTVPSSTPTPTPLPSTEGQEKEQKETETPSPAPSDTLRPTRERTRPPDFTSQPTRERTRPPDFTSRPTRERTRPPDFTPQATPEATRPPDHTPQPTRERTRPPDHTPQATREATRPPDHTPQPTREGTRPPDFTPQATREATRQSDHTPQATREATRPPDHTPEATRERTGSPDQTLRPTRQSSRRIYDVD